MSICGPKSFLIVKFWIVDPYTYTIYDHLKHKTSPFVYENEFPILTDESLHLVSPKKKPSVSYFSM